MASGTSAPVEGHRSSTQKICKIGGECGKRCKISCECGEKNYRLEAVKIQKFSTEFSDEII